MSLTRIHQDLVSEHQAQPSYDSVRRFVKRLGRARAHCRFAAWSASPAKRPRSISAPARRSSCRTASGVGRTSFASCLSHSRKAYSEAGLPADDRGLHPRDRECLLALRRRAQDAGDRQPQGGGHASRLVRSRTESQAAIVLPALRHGDLAHQALHAAAQGKDRTRASATSKDNALKGRTFASLEEQNRHLLDWERTVADTRIHGTTHKQVGKQFVEGRACGVARRCRSERFPFFHEAERSVNRDGHVEVAKAYYSAPTGISGPARCGSAGTRRLVRIFNHRLEQIAMHVRHEPGRFSTQPEHIAAEKISGVERGAAWLLAKVERIGPHSQRLGRSHAGSPRNRRNARAARAS